MPLSLEGVEAHPASYIGPQFVTIGLQMLQTGVLFNQVYAFWLRAEREVAVVRALAAFVSVVAFAQTALTFFGAWRVFVLNFGNWYVGVGFFWVDKIQSIVTVIIASPVQAFLIWRCWVLVNRNIFVLLTLSALLLATLISSVFVTITTLQFHFGIVQVQEGPLPEVMINPTFVLCLTCSALLDVLVTGILLTFLARSKNAVTSSRFRRIMRRLTVLIWEAALPPAICATITVVTYLTIVNKNYWDLTFQGVLGKLYAISLFVTLNGRAELQNAPHSGVSTQRISNMAWTSPIRVDLSTQLPSDVERDAQSGGTTETTEDRSVIETPMDAVANDVRARLVSNAGKPPCP